MIMVVIVVVEVVVVVVVVRFSVYFGGRAGRICQTT